MYLSYEEYAAMGGKLAAGEFTLAELSARKYIDSLTHGRVAGMAEAPEEVKAAMAVIMQVDSAFGAAAQASAPMVASFSTDGYSESYGGARERTDAAQRQLRATVERLLYGVTDDAGVPLLFAGIGCAGA